jgi:hypothetical protein
MRQSLLVCALLATSALTTASMVQANPNPILYGDGIGAADNWTTNFQQTDTYLDPNILFISIYMDPSDALDAGETISATFGPRGVGQVGWHGTEWNYPGPLDFVQFTYSGEMYPAWLDGTYGYNIWMEELGQSVQPVSGGIVTGYTDSTGLVYSSGPSPIWNGSSGTPPSWYSPSQESNYCFRKGTLILTPEGEVPIETLKPGQFVSLYGGRLGQLKKVTCSLTYEPLVCFHPGSLGCASSRDGLVGEGEPKRKLYITGAHEIYFPEHHCLVLARDLVNGESIREVDLGPTEIFHLDLGSHQVVIAEGATVESLALTYEHYAPVHCKARGRRYRLKRWLLAPFSPKAPEYVLRDQLAGRI